MPRLKKTRGTDADVGRYRTVNTGTANPPIKKQSRLAGTRVESGGVTEHEPVGVNAKKGNTRMRKTRVTT